MTPKLVPIVLNKQSLLSGHSPAHCAAQEPRQDRQREQEVESRVYLESPPYEEPLDPDLPALLILREQQAAYKKPTQDEEQIHAHPSTQIPEPRCVVVIAKD